MSQYVVLGAGVAGLTTALELKHRHPSAHVIIAAKYIPGDLNIQYTSPWAGANWLSTATDNGRQEEWDAVTYRKFNELAKSTPESGVQTMDIRAIFDSEKEDAGILSQGTGKVWYEKLVGGLRPIPDAELPAGAKFGFELSTFVINVQSYLPWLYVTALKAGVDVRRAFYDDIRKVFQAFPSAKAFFNCTGIGSYNLKGVEDHKLYPTLGQVMLVESPSTPIEQMYFRSPKRTHSDISHVFPRGRYGGVIIGGCRRDGVWEAEPDMEFAEDIKRRACALCPGLGKPEELKVIKHGVGLRPSRKGGARLEKEKIDGSLVIHNYGAGGAGYQSSWGMAKEAVDLLSNGARL